MSSQNWKAVSARWTSMEADRDCCFCPVDDDAAAVGDSLVTEWEHRSIFGVVIGEGEGDLVGSQRGVLECFVFFMGEEGFVLVGLEI